MQVSVEWMGEGLRFEGHGPNEVDVKIDGDGLDGTSPMSLLLHAIGACAGIDVVHILKRMRQPYTGVKVFIEGVRRETEYPKIWEKIHLNFVVSGEVSREKAVEAVRLSMEKYCSVAGMLKQSAEITWETNLVD